MLVVRVSRRDLLAQHASLMLAQQTNKWHSWSEVEKRRVTIRIDESEFRSHVERAVGILEKIDGLRASHPVHEVGYERDIVGDTGGGVAGLYEFLGLSWVAPDWLDSHKVSPQLEEFVENHDEARELFAELRVTYPRIDGQAGPR
jgi:hypothetical protein